MQATAQEHPPLVVMKTQWTPRTAARRRLERLRNQPPRLRRRYKYIFSPPLNTDHLHENNKSDYKSNIYATNENKHVTTDTDHSSSNKKLDKNKITTDIPPPFHFHDLLPEYKIYLYWEVKAG